jgi:ABC-2 type transport system permease protein
MKTAPAKPVRNASVKACISLLRIDTAQNLQYRFAGLTNSVTGVFWGIVLIAIYRVFFIYGVDYETAMTLGQTVSYVWLAQALIAFQPISINPDIATKITNGDIGVELCRPMDLYLHWFAKTAAPRLSLFLLRGTPVIAVGALLPAGYNLTLPHSLAGFLLMLLSVCIAFILSMSFMMFVTAIRMDVRQGDGPMWMMTITSGVLSGSYIPLQLWPDAMQTFLLLQPFAGYLDIPLRLYVGSMPPSDAAFAIAVQLVWTVIFIVAGRSLMNYRLKRVAVQGG